MGPLGWGVNNVGGGGGGAVPMCGFNKMVP